MVRALGDGGPGNHTSAVLVGAEALFGTEAADAQQRARPWDYIDHLLRRQRSERRPNASRAEYSGRTSGESGNADRNAGVFRRVDDLFAAGWRAALTRTAGIARSSSV